MRPVPWVQNVQAFAYIRVLALGSEGGIQPSKPCFSQQPLIGSWGLLDVRQPKQVQRAVTEAVETQSSSGWLFLLLQAALASLSGEAECAIWRPALASGDSAKKTSDPRRRPPRHQPFQCLASTDSGGGLVV